MRGGGGGGVGRRGGGGGRGGNRLVSCGCCFSAGHPPLAALVCWPRLWSFFRFFLFTRKAHGAPFITCHSSADGGLWPPRAAATHANLFCVAATVCTSAPSPTSPAAHSPPSSCSLRRRPQVGPRRRQAHLVSRGRVTTRLLLRPRTSATTPITRVLLRIKRRRLLLQRRRRRLLRWRRRRRRRRWRGWRRRRPGCRRGRQRSPPRGRRKRPKLVGARHGTKDRRGVEVGRRPRPVCPLPDPAVPAPVMAAAVVGALVQARAAG
ncbi:hypothetical protein BU14_0216s0027 [Porphyra umbilicalis]|uniref:Uncharacterized protein n=1 Tax=Porphyra umbilicalis TaxID=2786 RepID=A0A1X6P596_PORUM|nr:hypothetical protein BU14_0216s0027 [Porphyra umbilicalis]|eukprot:OSX75936.1 hypothetical protein BU14_0216s0027 [Porphyra umbilicalis]